MNHQQATARSLAEARRRLQALHQDDWERIYGEERERVGLPRVRSMKQLSEENRHLRQRIAELEEAEDAS